MEAFLSGVVAGYGIAIPVGAIAAYLVVLTARTSLRVGGSAALGVASADGVYAMLAVLGGAALADAVGSVAGTLRLVSFLVLLVLAGRIGFVTVAELVTPHRSATGPAVAPRPLRAYVTLLGATLLNPTTVVYFAALVLGSRSSIVQSVPGGAAFVVGAFMASASWQLMVAGSGAALGSVLTGPVGRLVTGLVSTALIVVLAIWIVLPA